MSFEPLEDRIEPVGVYIDRVWYKDLETGQERTDGVVACHRSQVLIGIHCDPGYEGSYTVYFQRVPGGARVKLENVKLSSPGLVIAVPIHEPPSIAGSYTMHVEVWRDGTKIHEYDAPYNIYGGAGAPPGGGHGVPSPPSSPPWMSYVLPVLIAGGAVAGGVTLFLLLTRRSRT